MSKINQQIINSDLQDQLLNEPQILKSKQQARSHDTFTQLSKKKKINYIKIVYPKQHTLTHQDRQILTKSQTKNKVFQRHRIFTNRFQTQACIQQSKQKSFSPKVEQNDSFYNQSQLAKHSNIKKNIFFDQIILSPKQRLESFRSHLKAVRQQNETYLKNKMSIIKQKIKRKIEKEPNQRTKGTLWTKKYEKTKDMTNEKHAKLSKIQRYNDSFEEEIIRKSIQIKKCQIISCNSQNKLSLQQEESPQANNNAKNTQKICRNQPRFYQPSQQIHIRGENKRKLNLNNVLTKKEQNYKMMIVNRLSPLRNFVSVVKPEKLLEKKKIESGDLKLGYFFNIKALDQTLVAQTTSHKYSKSFDISLLEKKLSQETTAHNSIKGSVLYRLLKERNQNKNRQTRTLYIQNLHKNLQAGQKIKQLKIELMKYQPVIETKQASQQPKKKKKVVVLSNKNITKYKSEYQGRIKYGYLNNKIDQSLQFFRSQIFQQKQAKV